MLRHWQLDRDPFVGPTPPYVPIPAHDEAVARLVDAVETGQRRIRLVAPAGCGKSMVLDRALSRLRGPRLRVAKVSRPVDGPSMVAEMAAALGVPAGLISTRVEAWRALADACKLCRAQGIGVVLAVDEADRLAEDADRRDLEHLDHVDHHPSARLTVLRVGRRETGWSTVVSLPRLTRSEADEYLEAKLRAAGRVDRIYTPRAVARLHALARGVTRDLDRLASRALWEGRARDLRILGPEVIDLVAL